MKKYIIFFLVILSPDMVVLGKKVKGKKEHVHLYSTVTLLARLRG